MTGQKTGQKTTAETTSEEYAAIVEGDSATFVEVCGHNLQPLDAAPWRGGRPSGLPRAAAEVAFACPVAPSKIIAVAKNYRAHATEMSGEVPDEPLFFFKPPSSLVGPGAAVRLPRISERVDHEIELGVVIGRRCRRVSPERAMEYVFGYTVVCDVTARDLQKKEKLWTRAKGFDTFCPTGPGVTRGIDASDLSLELKVNGQMRQEGRTSDMVFDIPTLIPAASQFLTLMPGDLIATGTPHGVGPLKAGDRVQMAIENVGWFEFPVVEETPTSILAKAALATGATAAAEKA